MVTAIKQTVTVQKDGKIEIPTSELPAGATAEVIVLVEGEAKPKRKWSRNLSPAELKKATEDFLKKAPTSSLGHSTDMSNEAVDADIAKDYERGLDEKETA